MYFLSNKLLNKLIFRNVTPSVTSFDLHLSQMIRRHTQKQCKREQITKKKSLVEGL